MSSTIMFEKPLEILNEIAVFRKLCTGLTQTVSPIISETHNPIYPKGETNIGQSLEGKYS